MVAIVYPDELQKSHWDRKKSALSGAGDLEDLLKKLQKKHDGVEWAKWADWAKGLGTQADAKTSKEALEKSYRTKALPLKFEAASVAAAADKAGKSKTLSKEQRDALQQIGKAAGAYGKAIDDGLDDLEAELKAALKTLPETAGDDEDEATSALVDPARLLKQLKLCQADGGRTMHYAMVDDGKSAPQLVLHARQAGRGLFAKLVKDLDIKTGSYGQAAVDGTTLRLVVEKKLGSLAKRIRLPVRASGFKVGKVVLVDENGLVEEDLEDEEAASAGTAAKGGAEQAATATQGTAAGRAGVSAAEAQKAWTAAREAAFNTLKAVAKDIAELRDDESNDAIEQIRAVMKTLTPQPATKAQVALLERFVDKDDVVQDVCDFAEDIRTPMLKALALLQQATPG